MVNSLVIISSGGLSSDSLGLNVTSRHIGEVWNLETKYYNVDICVSDILTNAANSVIIRYFHDIKCCLDFIASVDTNLRLSFKHQMFAVAILDSDLGNTEENRRSIVDYCFDNEIEIFFGEFTKAAELGGMSSFDEDDNGCTALLESLKCVDWDDMNMCDIPKFNLDSMKDVLDEYPIVGKLPDCEAVEEDIKNESDANADSINIEQQMDQMDKFFSHLMKTKEEINSGKYNDEERRHLVSSMFMEMMGDVFGEEDEEDFVEDSDRDGSTAHEGEDCCQNTN